MTKKERRQSSCHLSLDDLLYHSHSYVNVHEGEEIQSMTNEIQNYMFWLSDHYYLTFW